MQEYEIVLTQEALCDLAEIADYIENAFSIEDADYFQVRIEQEFERLSDFPKSYASTRYSYRGYVIYKKVFSPSLIFYIVKEEEYEVHILHVVREDRNWKWILIHTDEF